MKRVRIAVVGVGYLGRQHVRIYSELPDVDIIAVVDSNPNTLESVAREFHANAVPDYRELFGNVDAVSLAVPTTLHASMACEFLQHGIDVLVEKPIASSIAEAAAMIESSQRHQSILQVGHLERFNPAVIAARKLARSPLFFEVHRLGVFSSRSLDVDVVFDLMIHDLDVILDFVQSKVKAVHAVGLPILSHKIDIANARIEFQNGCVANLTASRVSTEKVRKLRFFQPNEYVSLDYSRQDVVVLTVQPGMGGKPLITPRKLETPHVEPLREEIKSFLEAVRGRTAPEVSAESSKAALELAQAVVEGIHVHAELLPISSK